MKVLGVTLVLLCGVIAVTLAGEALLPKSEHPDHPGKCHDEGTNTLIAPDETKKLPGTCTKVRCAEDLSLTYTTCGSVIIEDPSCVKIEQDFTKDYPECCHKYKCEKDGVVVYH